MSWREALARKAAAVAYEKGPDGLDAKEVWVDVPPEVAEGVWPDLIGRVNAAELAGLAPGMALLVAGGPNDRGAVLVFSVRKDVPWNTMPCIRDGWRRHVEVFDADGRPPYIPFDFNTLPVAR